MGKAQVKFRFSVVVVISALFTFLGCATTSNELRIGLLTPNQRVYVGRVKVDFGGLPEDELKCELYINRDIVPAFKLSRDGYFFYKTDRSEARLSKIACYHRANLYLAAWHLQKIPLKPFYRPENQKEAIYFGDLFIKWDFDKAATEPAAERLPYTQTPPREAHVYDSGTLTVEIKNDFEVMNRIFYERVEGARENNFVLKEHLVEKE